MKHLMWVAALSVVCAPVLAQPNPGGPVQLHNPHNSAAGGFMGGGGVAGGGGGLAGGGGVGGGMPGGQFGQGFFSASPMQAPPTPPATMLSDGAFLFILRGDTLMQFDKKTLTLLRSVELPHPVAPQRDPSAHNAPPRQLPPEPGDGGRGFGSGGPTF